MPDNPTCATCRWFVEADRANRESLGIERIGHCYARPPALANGARPMTFPRDFCGEHAPRVKEPRCWLHPDRITDGNTLFGRHLCGDCWMEWMAAEQDGATPAFRAKIYKGPVESPDASV